MNIFRRLDAMSGPITAALVASTRRTAEAPETTASPAVWEPATEHPEIWAALAAVGNSGGVIDHSTAGFPVPASTEGDSQ